MAVLPQQGLQFRCYFGWEWQEREEEEEGRGGGRRGKGGKQVQTPTSDCDIYLATKPNWRRSWRTKEKNKPQKKLHDCADKCCSLGEGRRGTLGCNKATSLWGSRVQTTREIQITQSHNEKLHIYSWACPSNKLTGDGGWWKGGGEINKPFRRTPAD